VNTSVVNRVIDGCRGTRQVVLDLVWLFGRGGSASS